MEWYGRQESEVNGNTSGRESCQKSVACLVFLSLVGGGQEGFRRESRKRVNPLAQNFGRCWFTQGIPFDSRGAWILAINCDQLVACRLQGQREILLLAVGLRIANNADLYRPHLLRDSSRSNIEVQHTLGISSDPLGQFGGLHYSRCRTMLPRAFYQALRYTVCAALIRKRGNCVHAPRQILGRR